jgi:chromosome transmission fidelity protein 18
MGKTTLAHVVAKHCGYRPLEINASDDRSQGVLKDKMVSDRVLLLLLWPAKRGGVVQVRAMQNQSIAEDRRPPCIILDEVSHGRC